MQHMKENGRNTVQVIAKQVEIIEVSDTYVKVEQRGDVWEWHYFHDLRSLLESSIGATGTATLLRSRSGTDTLTSFI